MHAQQASAHNTQLFITVLLSLCSDCQVAIVKSVSITDHKLAIGIVNIQFLHQKSPKIIIILITRGFSILQGIETPQ